MVEILSTALFRCLSIACVSLCLSWERDSSSAALPKVASIFPLLSVFFFLGGEFLLILVYKNTRRDFCVVVFIYYSTCTKTINFHVQISLPSSQAAVWSSNESSIVNLTRYPRKFMIQRLRSVRLCAFVRARVYARNHLSRHLCNRFPIQLKHCYGNDRCKHLHSNTRKTQR